MGMYWYIMDLKWGVIVKKMAVSMKGKRRKSEAPSCIRALYGATTNLHENYLPSGNLLHNYGKSPFLVGKLTISMAIFNSYVYVYQRISSKTMIFQPWDRDLPSFDLGKNDWIICHFIYGMSSETHWRTPSFFKMVKTTNQMYVYHFLMFLVG